MGGREGGKGGRRGGKGEKGKEGEGGRERGGGSWGCILRVWGRRNGNFAACIALDRRCGERLGLDPLRFLLHLHLLFPSSFFFIIFLFRPEPRDQSLRFCSLILCYIMWNGPISPIPYPHHTLNLFFFALPHIHHNPSPQLLGPPRPQSPFQLFTVSVKACFDRSRNLGLAFSDKV